MLLYLSIFTRKSHNLKQTSLKIIISFDFDNDHLPLRYLPPRQQSLATTLTWLKTKHLFLRICRHHRHHLCIEHRRLVVGARVLRDDTAVLNPLSSQQGNKYTIMKVLQS